VWKKKGRIKGGQKYKIQEGRKDAGRARTTRFSGLEEYRKGRNWEMKGRRRDRGKDRKNYKIYSEG
jgi:hypothetical protein